MGSREPCLPVGAGRSGINRHHPQIHRHRPALKVCELKRQHLQAGKSALRLLAPGCLAEDRETEVWTENSRIAISVHTSSNSLLPKKSKFKTSQNSRENGTMTETVQFIHNRQYNHPQRPSIGINTGQINDV